MDGTMPKECMIVWIMETTDHEEMMATEEMKAKEEEKIETKGKRKKGAERKGKECGTTPTRRRTKAREIAYTQSSI
jgi:hypothetical protein